MSTVADPPIRTLADLLERLGHVPLDRIRFRPPPGTATERDVLEIAAQKRGLCELVDGVLVEKPVGFNESVLAIFIGSSLASFVRPRNLGHVTGEQGMMRLFPGLIRIPDAAFVSWDSFPQRRLTGEPIPDLAPDLVVEVLSASNTPAEMRIKLGEYFSTGVRLAWLVDPKTRTVAIFESPDDSVTLHEQDTLEGGTVLPGFTLSLSELFAELDRHG